MTAQQIAERHDWYGEILALSARHGVRFTIWVVRATDVESLAHLSTQQMKAIVRTWTDIG